jgi:hypothetical protein
MWFVLIVGTLVLGFMSAGTVFAGQSKVTICHITGQGTYEIITIADPAYPSHIAHGDKAVETFYIDADGDGYGSSLMTIADCTAPPGFVADNTDCDDTRAAVNPGATEVMGNGIDDDCDPATPDDVVCPCETQNMGTTSWSSSYTTLVCQVHPNGITLFANQTPPDGLAVVIFHDDNIDFCILRNDSAGILFFHINEAEAAACSASLLAIAAGDGVECNQ